MITLDAIGYIKNGFNSMATVTMINSLTCVPDKFTSEDINPLFGSLSKKQSFIKSMRKDCLIKRTAKGEYEKLTTVKTPLNLDKIAGINPRSSMFQLAALEFINANPNCTAREISDYLDRENTDLRNSMHYMTKAGMVDIEQVKGVNRYSLSDKARSILF